MSVWTWDPSPSPDVAVYVLAAYIAFRVGSPPQLVDVAEVPAEVLTLEYDLPIDVGECMFLNVDAIDEAGNRSERGI